MLVILQLLKTGTILTVKIDHLEKIIWFNFISTNSADTKVLSSCKKKSFDSYALGVKGTRALCVVKPSFPIERLLALVLLRFCQNFQMIFAKNNVWSYNKKMYHSDS